MNFELFYCWLPWCLKKKERKKEKNRDSGVTEWQLQEVRYYRIRWPRAESLEKRWAFAPNCQWLVEADSSSMEHLVIDHTLLIKACLRPSLYFLSCHSLTSQHSVTQGLRLSEGSSTAWVAFWIQKQQSSRSDDRGGEMVEMEILTFLLRIGKGGPVKLTFSNSIEHVHGIEEEEFSVSFFLFSWLLWTLHQCVVMRWLQTSTSRCMLHGVIVCATLSAELQHVLACRSKGKISDFPVKVFKKKLLLQERAGLYLKAWKDKSIFKSSGEKIQISNKIVLSKSSIFFYWNGLGTNFVAGAFLVSWISWIMLIRVKAWLDYFGHFRLSARVPGQILTSYFHHWTLQRIKKTLLDQSLWFWSAVAL